MKRKTHRLVGLVRLAQCRRSTIYFFNHASQILAHFIQALGKLLRKFVTIPLLIHQVQCLHILNGTKKKKVLTFSHVPGQVPGASHQDQLALIASRQPRVHIGQAMRSAPPAALQPTLVGVQLLE